ncbi:MAG: sporulation transcriptional regulator SpoIIID [Cetobacterium sp.]
MNKSTYKKNTKYSKAFHLEQSIEIGNYMIETKKTIRETAKYFNTSKTTIAGRLNYLKNMDKSLYNEVEKVLKTNFANRTINGGNSLKHKWKEINKMKSTKKDILSYDRFTGDKNIYNTNFSTFLIELAPVIKYTRIAIEKKHLPIATEVDIEYILTITAYKVFCEHDPSKGVCIMTNIIQAMHSKGIEIYNNLTEFEKITQLDEKLFHTKLDDINENYVKMLNKKLDRASQKIIDKYYIEKKNIETISKETRFETDYIRNLLLATSNYISKNSFYDVGYNNLKGKKLQRKLQNVSPIIDKKRTKGESKMKNNKEEIPMKYTERKVDLVGVKLKGALGVYDITDDKVILKNDNSIDGETEITLINKNLNKLIDDLMSIRETMEDMRLI